MSARINDGGPVHPIVETNGQGQPELTHTGISLRDYFAAKAMQGFCADPSNHELFVDQADVARNAYLLADAMLRARGAA